MGHVKSYWGLFVYLSLFQKQCFAFLILSTHCLLGDTLALLVLLGNVRDGEAFFFEYLLAELFAVFFSLSCGDFGGWIVAYLGEGTASASRPCPGP